MTLRLVLAACAWAAVLAQDPACVDDPTWVKNGDEPWKDCAWAAEYIPTRCAVRMSSSRGVSARGTCGDGRSGGRRWGLYPPSGRRRP